MKVPLTDREIAIIQSMPRTPHGHVIDPQYAPDLWADDYIRRLGEWARRTPKSDWPDWFSGYVAERKRKSEKPRSRSAFLGVDHDAEGEVAGPEGNGSPGGDGSDREA